MNKDIAMLRIRMASYVEQGRGHRGSGVVLYKCNGSPVPRFDLVIL